MSIILFVKKILMEKCTGISFIDGTTLWGCRNRRKYIHKTFKGMAQRGKCSMKWLFGFELHLIYNEKESQFHDNTSETWTTWNNWNTMPLWIFIYVKLIAGKGYIDKELFHKLFGDWIHFIIKLKSNMEIAIMRGQ